jgi:transposase
VKGRPLIQIGLAVNFEQGIPIFHKVFNGNIHDSKSLRDIITTFQDYNIRRGIFVFDRGITSKINLYEIKKILKWDVLCGLALNVSLKQTLRSIVKTEKIVQYSNRIRLKNAIFYVIEKKYTHGEINGKIAICFNEQSQSDLKESRYDEILNAQKLLLEGKKIKTGLEGFFDR